MATNAVTAAGSPYMAGLAQFDRMYSATDADTLYNNPSIFYNPMTSMADPAMAMMGMMNPMMMGYNPMMQKMFTPASYDAQRNGINPMGSFYFGGKSEQFQQYNNQTLVGQNGLKQLHQYAISDNQDDFEATFNNLLNIEKQRIKTLQPNIDDVTLNQVAKAAIRENYSRLTGGVSLDQVLQKNGDNPFWQGMKDIFSFGMGWDKQTVQENIAYINDAPMSSSQRTRESAMQWLGRGAAVVGALLILKKGGLKGAWKALNWAVRSPESYKTWAEAAKAAA